MISIIIAILKNLLLFVTNKDTESDGRFSVLRVEELENGKDRKLLESMTYQSNFGDITVPKDFITDYASVPRFLWVFAPPSTGRYKFPATVHDWLYRTEMFKRDKCDEIFLDGMRDMGLNRIKAYMLYLGVRMGGWYTWWRDHSYESLEKHRSLAPDFKFRLNRFKKKED